MTNKFKDKKVTYTDWRNFVQCIKTCCLYSDEEITTLLNYYYDERKIRDPDTLGELK